MPYPRKSYPGKKRKYSGRRRFKRYGSKIGSAAYTALKIAKRLKDVVNVEYKFLANNASAGYDYNGTMYTLNSIPQGDTDVTRDGDSCKIQRFTIRGEMQKQSALDATMVRIIIFWDNQNKTAAISDFLENPGSGYATISPKKYDNRFQTKTLYDRVFNLNSGGNTQRLFKASIPINLHTQFSAGSTTITTGALKMIILSNQVTTNLPVVTWLSKTTFTDN